MLDELEERVAKLEAALALSQINYNDCLDTIWMLTATMLVFFMHSGFSLLEVGSVRFKSTQYILAKNLAVVGMGFLCWFVLGYPLAYGSSGDDVEVGGSSSFAGSGGFAMEGLYGSSAKLRAWLWQGAFCATSATIASGAMAERTQVKGFVVYTAVVTTIVYPIVAHWGWSGHGIFKFEDGGVMRSLAGPAVVDFAGSGMVHLVGGVGALCGAVVVGPRRGRFEDPTVENEFDAPNVPFVVTGTLFLWFGWFGFNAGSTGSMHDISAAHTAAVAAVNTAISPCVSGVVVFFMRTMVLKPKAFDVPGFCNGVLAGLVSITAGCATVVSWEAMIIGFIGGLLYVAVSALVKRSKVDDVVDAFAVHGACGCWGLIAAGLFGGPIVKGNGLFHGGDQLRAQLFAVVVIVLWSGVLSLVIFVPLRLANMLRYAEDFQEAMEREHITMVKAYVERHMTEHSTTSSAKAAAVEPTLPPQDTPPQSLKNAVEPGMTFATAQDERPTQSTETLQTQSSEALTVYRGAGCVAV
mmetsp:Transcript_4674/g.13520  ORF Transcript_4674/g.13520 Transcript_4674/m.13520 type:complete len:523 (+) Transcript_4674:47-1615(+)